MNFHQIQFDGSVEMARDMLDQMLEEHHRCEISRKKLNKTNAVLFVEFSNERGIQGHIVHGKVWDKNLETVTQLVVEKDLQMFWFDGRSLYGNDPESGRGMMCHRSWMASTN